MFFVTLPDILFLVMFWIYKHFSLPHMLSVVGELVLSVLLGIEHSCLLWAQTGFEKHKDRFCHGIRVRADLPLLFRGYVHVRVPPEKEHTLSMGTIDWFWDCRALRGINCILSQDCTIVSRCSAVRILAIFVLWWWVLCHCSLYKYCCK